MQYAVVTGSSKGLGTAICKKFIQEGVGVISIARSENTQLQSHAANHGIPYHHFACDLSVIEEVEQVATKVLDLLEAVDIDKLYVVNNAGVVNPIEIVGLLENQDVIKHFSINLHAPIFLSNEFLHKSNKIPTVVINITSGAGSRPMHGWSIYCSSKAALNMFTQTTALELKNTHSAHKIIAFSPGIMDTEMQGEIRSSSKESFSDIETFKEYKEKDMLRKPEIVANTLVELVTKEQVKSGEIYNISELLS